MNGEAPATLVWLAPSPPGTGQQRVLDTWARTHGLAFTDARPESPPTLPVDLRWAGAIDDALDRARDAIEAHEAAAADRALAEAQAVLAAHPELPEAAWQMAELERTRARRWQRIEPIDEAAAAQALVRAQALDGGRVAGAGETAPPIGPEAAELEVELPPEQSALLDGRVASPNGRERALAAAGTLAQARGALGSGEARWTTWAGPHALVVTWSERPVWAAWLDLPPGRSLLRPGSPLPPPCSTADVGAVAGGTNRPVHVESVRCPRWVAARPAGGEHLQIASCREAVCEPWTEAEPAAQLALEPMPSGGHAAARWPAWATWALAGTGVVVTATAALAIVALGRRAGAAETRFVGGGLAGP